MEATYYDEAGSTRCPGLHHQHWQHRDAGLEPAASDGVSRQRPLSSSSPLLSRERRVACRLGTLRAPSRWRRHLSRRDHVVP